MNGAAGTSAAAAAAAATANAVKAAGVVVEMQPSEFSKLLNRADRPMVIAAKAGWMYRKIRYAFAYKGFVFVTVTTERIGLPSGSELVWAGKIWVPN